MWAQGQASALNEHFSFASRVANAIVSYGGLSGPVLLSGRIGCVLSPSGKRPAGVESRWLGRCSAGLHLGLGDGVWRQRPYLLVGWLWYVGMLVPVIGLVQVGGQAMADRYTYLPQIGVCIALAWGAADLCRGRSFAADCVEWRQAIALAALMPCAWRQSVLLARQLLALDPRWPAPPTTAWLESTSATPCACEADYDEAKAQYGPALQDQTRRLRSLYRSCRPLDGARPTRQGNGLLPPRPANPAERRRGPLRPGQRIGRPRPAQAGDVALPSGDGSEDRSTLKPTMALATC